MGIRILLADDFEMVRAGLRGILERQADLEVIGEAADGREAVELACTLRPDVIIMDLMMPNLNGIEATRQIAAKQIDARIIALAAHQDREMLAATLDAGAWGFLLKSSDPQKLIEAVRTVYRGERFVISAEGTAGAAPNEEQPSALSAFGALTPKQREVLQLLAEGLSNKEIAKAMRISVKTAEAHRAQIMQKLQIRTIAGLTKYAIREGITSIDG